MVAPSSRTSTSERSSREHLHGNLVLTRQFARAPSGMAGIRRTPTESLDHPSVRLMWAFRECATRVFMGQHVDPVPHDWRSRAERGRPSPCPTCRDDVGYPPASLIVTL